MAKAKPKFPLSLHKQTGHYYKRIKGKQHWFGSDRDEALAKYYRQRDDLEAGKPVRDDEAVVTLSYVCNYCLTRKKELVEQGELSAIQYRDLRMMAEYIIEHFGRNRNVATIGPDDFAKLRTKMVDRWAPSGLVARIANVKHIFRFAYQEAVIQDEIRFGSQFRAPSKKRRREARAAGGERLFEPAEIHTLLKYGSEHLQAFVLLGLANGLGNSDIAKLSLDDVDLEAGWLDYPRPKTGVPRRSKLWPETVEAIQAAREVQPVSRGEHQDLVFLTHRRKPWSNPETSTCALAQAFRKLLNDTNLYSRGKTFYALRHCTETIGSEARDQIALDVVMGHESPGMASVYRERISDERLIAVSNVIHDWLYG